MRYHQQGFRNIILQLKTYTSVNFKIDQHAVAIKINLTF